nr:hypothetical protein [Rubellimicrobium roseum]
MALHRCADRHGREHVPDLIEAGHPLLAPGAGHRDLLVREVEIVGVRISDVGLEAGQVRQPEEELAQVPERGEHGGLAQPLPRAQALRLGQLALERHDLLAVEALELAPAGGRLKARERFRDPADGGLVPALRLPEVAEVVALDPLVGRIGLGELAIAVAARTDAGTGIGLALGTVVRVGFGAAAGVRFGAIRLLLLVLSDSSARSDSSGRAWSSPSSLRSVAGARLSRAALSMYSCATSPKVVPMAIRAAMRSRRLVAEGSSPVLAASRAASRALRASLTVISG